MHIVAYILGITKDSETIPFPSWDISQNTNYQCLANVD